MTTFHIAELFGIGYVHAAIMATAVNASRKTGLRTVDRIVFGEHDFAVAEPTEIVRQTNTNAPPRDRDTYASPRDQDTDVPPRYQDTDATPHDRDVWIGTQTTASTARINNCSFAKTQNQLGYNAKSYREREDLHHYRQPALVRKKPKPWQH